MKNLFAILSFVLPIIGLGQKPFLHLELDKKEVQVGEVFTLQVKSNINGHFDIELPPGFTHGYNVMNGMEQEMDYNSGKIITYYYHSQTGSMPKPGMYKIGPAIIKKGFKIYKSNVITVQVGKSKPTKIPDGLNSKLLNQAVFGLIEKSKSSIYEGEPVVLNAKVYSRFDATVLRNYEAYTLEGVLDKHELGNNNNIILEEEQIRNNTFYTFVYDKKIVFPTLTGKHQIEPFKLVLSRGFEQIPLTSAATHIEVKPLPSPAPKDFIGAVGNFTVSTKIDHTELKQGDVFTFIVSIAGYGNLQNILEPKLLLPKGFVIYGDPIIKEDYVFNTKGAEGKMDFQYHIQATKYGKIQMPEVQISFFDPEQEKYISIASSSHDLTITKNNNFNLASVDSLNSAQKNKKQEFLPLNAPTNISNSQSPSIGKILIWILLFLSLGIAALFISKKYQSFKKPLPRRKKTAPILDFSFISEAEKMVQNGEYIPSISHLEKGLINVLNQRFFFDTNQTHSKIEILEKFKRENFDIELHKTISDLFINFEKIRYSPEQDQAQFTSQILQTKKVIQSIKN